MEQFKGQPSLPKFAVPKRYDIRLKPDLVACKFSGFVAIDVDVVADTRFIVLNAGELTIQNGAVSFALRNSSKVLEPSNIHLIEEDEILVLEFAENIPSGMRGHIILKLGWDLKQGESHLDAMVRGEILTALAKFGHDETLNEASRRFEALLADRNTQLLPPDIRRAVYVAVMQRVTKSNRAGFESLLRLYRETDLSQEKTRILGSLASCPDPSIVLEVLNFVLSPEVRNQDAVYGVCVSWEGRETAWAWLKENWEYISKTWGSGFLLISSISSIVSLFASLEKAKSGGVLWYKKQAVNSKNIEAEH